MERMSFPRGRLLFRPLEIVLLVALVIVGASVWAYRSLGIADPEIGGLDEDRPGSVAVLPFENVGAEPANDYFSQGVSDEIRSALARVPGLEVASRTSSHARSGAGSVREIAEELQVESILEGSVQRAEDRVRVTVSLVDARTDRQLWTETFDRRLDVESLFEVEGEIARSVARALQGELGPLPLLTGDAPVSLEVHDLYLLGLFHWNRRTGPEMLRAADLFRRAAELDPGYALAQAGLANATLLLPLYAGVPAHEAMPEARAAAERALALDSTRAEAHAALGLVRTAYDWDWEGAEASFRRALELNERYATAHQWYGLLLDALDRHEQAEAHHRRALELDPLSVIINEVMGNHLVFTGRYEAAIEQLQRTLELQPDLPLALQFLGEAYLLAGRPTDAERTLRGWSEVTGAPVEPWTDVVRGVVSSEAAGQALEAVDALAADGALSPYWEAQLLALLGSRERTLDALRRGVERRDFLMFFVPADPAFGPYRDLEAFRVVMAEMGLEPPGGGG